MLKDFLKNPLFLRLLALSTSFHIPYPNRCFRALEVRFLKINFQNPSAWPSKVAFDVDTPIH